ncbi:hypothetical protein GPEL0_01r1546 [Geoanaerobacter pelophilus]|uniref:Uncharacterized protein n=2 Tax=Geoanaerobacter pelophilus TaxID=60036 RepID=A0ABQ0MGQ7_9BACT|nr:hypothetical protein GPEL0_01r1546 [Geoanaerobacter pelophilus]
MLVVAAVMAACGGGGSSTPPTATISGAVTFPSSGDVMAKRAGAVVADTSVAVEVFSLDGKKVGSTSETQYDNVQNTYSYSIPGLHTDIDYVVKVKRGIQVLKKLIDKKSLVEPTVKQNVDAATTATVMVAEQKLSTTQTKVVLGEELPAGSAPSSTAVASLSQEIEALNPKAIELNIATTVAGGKSTLTSETAAYANVYNMVVVAVTSNNVGSVEALLAPESTAAVVVPTFSVTGNTVNTTPVNTTVTSETAATVIGQATEVYVPPVTTPDTGSNYVTLAKAYLNNQDIANAYKNFELALMSDADNVEANVGAAITGGVMLLDDEQVRTIVDKWGYVYPTVNEVVQAISPVGNPFNNMTSATATMPGLAKTAASAPVAPAPARKMLEAFNALKGKMPQQKAGFKSLAKELGLVATTAPTVSEMQAVIDNVIIPKLNTVIALLAKAEAKSGNTFTITKQMQGNPQYGQDVVLADAEYYALDAAVNVFQTIFKFTTAYNFDLPSGYNYNTISQDPMAMIGDPKVFTLKADGRTKMNAALGYAKVAAAKTKAAYDMLKLRALGAGAFNIATWSDADKASFEKGLAEVTAAMNGETTIRSKGITIAVDFTKFFTNPLTRNNLPAFGYDVPRDATLSAKYGVATAAEVSFDDAWNPGLQPVKCDIQPLGDLPDFTLNGIFPGNTASSTLERARFSGVLPFLSGKVLSGVPNEDIWGHATDGQFIYYATQNATFTTVIKKIDIATGVVSLVATQSDAGSVGDLVYYNNGLHSINISYSQNGQIVTVSPITIAGTSFTVGTPVASVAINLPDYGQITAVTASGSDIYYAVQTWNQYTWTTDMQVRKLSNLQTDTLVFTELDDYFDNLSVYGGYLYSDGEKRSLTAPSVTLAKYVDVEDAVMIGGYFYDVYHGKLTKYAGSPNGSSAKTATRF